MAAECGDCPNFRLDENGTVPLSDVPVSDGTMPLARVTIAPTSAEAWQIVRRSASADDLICITGSFFLAAEMRQHVQGWGDSPSSSAPTSSSG